jgi:hypothetical protein
MTRMKHWQDLVNGVLGVWLAASPWLLGYQEQTVATWSALVAGLALCAAALGAVFVPRAWEEWIEAILGAWMIVSPWVLGFSGHPEAMHASVWTGAAALLLALWTLLTDEDYSPWRTQRNVR